MDLNGEQPYRVVVAHWSETDEIAQAICNVLTTLGHQVEPILRSEPLIESDVVFTFGPYGKTLQLLSQLESIPLERRPTCVHWNTEGIPDPRFPWFLIRAIGAARSWVGRLDTSSRSWTRAISRRWLLSRLDSRMLRFRYVGDYDYAYKKGWLHVLADTSILYAQLRSRHGVPTVYAPWGLIPDWYANLNLERDIDVLWMGKRATKRRSALLDRLREELRQHRIEIYVADNEENPFIFGERRTQYLNRAKITLNLTRTWYDDNFSRFALAAPNRSLLISEPVLPHCPQFEAGTHYVSAPVDTLAEIILFFLRNEEERLQLVEKAYQLVSTELTFKRSMQTIMNVVHRTRMTAGNPPLKRSKVDPLLRHESSQRSVKAAQGDNSEERS